MAEFQAHAKASVPASDPLIGCLIGRFFIRRLLGSGGMGEVYLADDTRLKRPVALKRMAPELNSDESYRRRFLKEAERASGVTGAHIAAIYDVLEQDGQVFLVMEYVEGQNLRQRLRQPLTLQAFLAIAVQCAEALVSAHARGIIHCDLKPENIMVSANGDVKVLDFGVAKHLPSSDQSSTMDKGHSLGGTPAYMAPEVLLEKAFDERADIFSLGVVFYEMLTGRHPFRAASFVETSHRIVHELPKPISHFNGDVPQPLQAVVSRMLAKDPDARFATASDLQGALRELHYASTILPAAKPPSWRSRAIWAVLVAAVVLAALAVSPLQRWLHLSPVPSEKHLAVLRFVSTGDDPNMHAFTDGLTETLTIKLAQLTGKYPLQVVPPSEIRAENVRTVDQARREFGVNLVLEGSLTESGNMVRINYALVDATTRRQLRGEVITAEAKDAFAVEDKVVDSVIKDLDLELQGIDRQALAARQTNAPAAFDYYLRGRGYLQDPKPENLDNAVAVFTHALDQDPNFSLAYAGLGEAYWQKYEHTGDSVWVDRARQACERAATLGSELSATHACLGTVFNGTGKYEDAVAQFRRATELDLTSDDAVRGLGSAYERLGKVGDAEAAYRRAIELRPQSWMGYNMLGGFYFRQSRYDDAAKQYSQVIQLAPDSYRGYSNLGAAYLALGRYSDATVPLKHSAEIRPTAGAYSNLGVAYFYQHKYEDAARSYERAIQAEESDENVWGNLAEAYYWVPKLRDQSAPAYKKAIALAEDKLRVNPRDASVLADLALYHAMLKEKAVSLDFLKRASAADPNDSEVLYKSAKVYNQFGDTDQALSYLEKAVNAGYSRVLPRDDPAFANLSSNPRFRKIVS